MRERIARTICSGRCLLQEIMDEPCLNADGSNGPCKASVNQLILSGKFKTADAIEKVIEDSGYAIVSREPTEEMIEAAGFEARRTAKGPWVTKFEVGREKWQAMIDEAKKTKS